MNSKAKGNRNERKARDLLYEKGAILVMKAGASLGVFDLIAFFPKFVLAAQVKTNRWPSKEEMATIRTFIHVPYLRKIVMRYRDRIRTGPDIREVE